MEKMKIKKTQIALLVVENRRRFHEDYVRWLTIQLMSRKIHGVKFFDGKALTIWATRRQMINEVLEKHKDLTHVLFVDTDVIPPDGFIDKLFLHNTPLVSGFYISPDDQNLPCSKKDGDYYTGKGLEEVDVFSMGATLIQREVLEKVEYPEANKSHRLDADSEFCKKAKEAGFKVMQDFDLVCKHIGIKYY